LPIYYKHDLLFTHVPKTGGTAVDRWLGGADNYHGHVPLNYMYAVLPHPQKHLYQKFTILRDPVDRIRSAWNHHVRKNTPLLKKYPAVFEKGFENGLLSSQYEEMITDEYSMIAIHFLPIDWLFRIDKTRAHNPGIVINFDNLQDEVYDFAEKVKLKITEPFIVRQSNYDRKPLSTHAQQRFDYLYREETILYDYYTKNH